MGSLGKPPAQHIPVEHDDTLQSTQLVSFVDLLCEGEIEGLVGGGKGIYFDGVPYVNEDGTNNFDGVDFVFRKGEKDQEYIDGLKSQEEFILDNTGRLEQDMPVTRSISRSSVDIVRVKIKVNSLYRIGSNGDTVGNYATGKIELALPQSTDFEEVKSIVFDGKTMGAYERSYEIDLRPYKTDNFGGDFVGNFRIRVTKTSADSYEDRRDQKDIFWSAYTEIIATSLTYPHSALVAMSIDSSLFSKVPVRAYKLKLLKVKIPKNYDPITRIYNGVWDGTFKVAWTDNPAWCFYDLVTNKRYGLGEYVDSDLIDKWSLYAIGRHCDEEIEIMEEAADQQFLSSPESNDEEDYRVTILDSAGNRTIIRKEPRFRLNCIISSPVEAYALLQELTSVFRAMIFWSSGTINIVQDTLKDVKLLFTNANVIDGEFSYSGESLQNKISAVVVSWNDPALLYKENVVYIEDLELIHKYGVIEKEVRAFGCTSKTQAIRTAKWLLLTSKYENEIVSFSASLEGLFLEPGDVIKIQDRLKTVNRLGGRIVDTSLGSITLDSEVTLGSSDYFITFKSKNLSGEEVLLEKELTNREEVTAVVTFKDILLDNQIPDKQSIWVISSTNLDSQKFRVTSIFEKEKNIYQITGMFYSDSKFVNMDNDVFIKVDSPSTAPLVEIPNITGYEEFVSFNQDSRTYSSSLFIKWETIRPTRYFYSIKREGENWIEEKETNLSSIELKNLEIGSYNFKVRTFSLFGIYSNYAYSTFEVKREITPPADVLNFNGSIVDGGFELTWNSNTEIDIDRYEIRLGYAWENARTVASVGFLDNTAFVLGNGRSFTFFIRAINCAGYYSIDSAILNFNIDYIEVTGFLAVQDLSSIHLVWDKTEFAREFELRVGRSFVQSQIIEITEDNTFNYNYDGWDAALTFYIRAIDLLGNRDNPYSYYSLFSIQTPLTEIVTTLNLLTPTLTQEDYYTINLLPYLSGLYLTLKRNKGFLFNTIDRNISGQTRLNFINEFYPVQRFVPPEIDPTIPIGDIDISLTPTIVENPVCRVKTELALPDAEEQDRYFDCITFNGEVTSLNGVIPETERSSHNFNKLFLYDGVRRDFIDRLNYTLEVPLEFSFSFYTVLAKNWTSSRLISFQQINANNFFKVAYYKDCIIFNVNNEKLKIDLSGFEATDKWFIVFIAASKSTISLNAVVKVIDFNFTRRGSLNLINSDVYDRLSV